MPTLHQTIVRPVVTEKSSRAYQDRGEYTFVVHPDASKGAIREAIERLWGVKVANVWTSQYRGKAKRVGRELGRRAHWKKAIVTLREGDAIPEIFEG